MSPQEVQILTNTESFQFICALQAEAQSILRGLAHNCAGRGRG